MKYPTKWDFSSFYKNDNDPKIKKDLDTYKKVHQRFVNKWEKRTDYLKNPTVLKEALTDYFALSKQGKGGMDYSFYLSLRQAQEQDNSKLKADDNKLHDLMVKIANEGQFFGLRLSKVDKPTQKKFLTSPLLKPYKKYLKDVFSEAKYLLSEPEEKIMNLKSGPSHSSWVDMTSTLLAKQEREIFDKEGKLVKKSFSEIASLSSNKDKKVRDKASEAFNEIVGQYAEVAEAEINAILGNKKVNDELRGWPRPDSSRHFSDEIDTEVVDALSGVVKDNFKIAQNFYALKAKLLKLPKLAYHERNVPYGKINSNYSYEEAVALSQKTFAKLDPEFTDIFTGFVKNGQIDVYPAKGKSGGAFCAYQTTLQPTFLLLNFTGELNDVLTLAHEVGHGINYELIKKKQPNYYFGTPTSTAEVASTFMEDFVLEEILNQADDELRLAILVMKLNDDISTIFRQISAYRFEQELHKTFREVGYLSAKQIGEIFQKHMSAYMGKAVSQDTGSENWWVYWGHFRSFFYVYSYAGGLLISKALQAKVRKDPKFIKEVKEFLSTGTSDRPKEIFKKMGVDITKKSFWQAGVKEIAELLTETEKLAKKLGKI